MTRSAKIIFFILILGGALVAIHSVGSHRSFFSDSAISYFNAVNTGTISYDWRHSRFTDIIFQVPALIYINLNQADFEVSTAFALLDWSFFFGIYAIYLLAFFVAYRSPKPYITLLPAIICFAFHFLHAGNSGGNTPSALAFATLYMVWFLTDQYERKPLITLVLLLAIAFGYQLFFILMFEIAGIIALDALISKKVTGKQVFYFIVHLFVAGYLIFKILRPTTPVGAGMSVLLLNRPVWVYGIAMLIFFIFAIQSTRRHGTKIFFLALACFGWIYYRSNYLENISDVYLAQHLRTFACLGGIFTFGLWALLSRLKPESQSLPTAKEWVLVALMGAITLSHNFLADQRFSAGVSHLLQRVSERDGCQDATDKDREYIGMYGVLPHDYPRISILAQKSRHPKGVLISKLDPQIFQYPDRSCADSYDIGLFETPAFGFGEPTELNVELMRKSLSDTLYMDFSSLDKE